MSDDISRDLIVDRLGSPEYPRFLCYLMGPYRSFDLTHYLTEAERAAMDVDELPGPIRKLFRSEDEVDDAKALLRRVQGELRNDPGVNAFLAVDLDVDVEEVDAMTQSIEYARCSNATAFILPYLGHNFGVGEETGGTLEALSEEYGERLVFVHEANVTSQMITAANRRWDLRLESYESEAELVDTLQAFVGGVMHRERRGALDRLDE